MSMYPFREMMLICNGCGGERMVPQEVLDTILSLEDFKRFASSGLAEYACRCGARSCNMRLVCNEPFEEAS